MSAKFSRRSFITTAGGATVFTCLPLKLLASEVPIPNPGAPTMSISKQDRKVSLYDSKNHKFDKLLSKHFPGLISDPSFASVRTFAAIIVHRGGPAVIAQSLHWHIETLSENFMVELIKTGRPKKGNALVRQINEQVNSRGMSKFSFRETEHQMRLWNSGKRKLISNGDVFLITPFCMWNAKRYRADRKVDWNALKNVDKSRTYISTKLTDPVSVTVRIDSLVFEDNTLAGKDVAKLGKRLTGSQRGEHSAAQGVLKLVDAGVRDGRIGGHLKRLAKDPPSGMTTRRQILERARQRQAAFLRRLFHKSGREGVETVGRFIAAHEPIKIARARA